MDAENENHNLHLSIVTLIVCTLVSAVSIICICDFVLETFQKSDAMALLITDAGVKSDDANLERNLSFATQALIMCKDFAWALVIGLVVCLGALVAKITKPQMDGVGVSGRGMGSKRL